MYTNSLEYQKTEINTADRVRIITLMYNGAINFIKLAKEKMQNGDIAGKGLYIGKATAVVGELASSLNLTEGGKIAENLKMLYDYILDKLLRGNLYNNQSELDEAIKILEVLKEGWKEIEKTQRNITDRHNTTLQTGVKI